MAEYPRDRLDRELDRIETRARDGDISTECRDALLEFATALDESKVEHTYHDADGDVVSYKPRSVEQYLRCLRLCTDAGLDLLDTDADAVNACLVEMHDVDGKSKSTMVGYSVAAAKFYRYFDLGVDPDAIKSFDADRTPKHDETDMFTDDEVRELRNACGESQMPTRNRAFLELLIFTGQRIRGIVTLRMQDVDPDAGYIYLNDEIAAEQGGLKGALVRGRKRPMFGAAKYVRDYIDYHRRDAGDDDWLFIGNPSHWKTDPDDHWAAVSADHVLRRIGDAAGVDKPVNAHNFRHYCATVLYRDYELDRDTIRMLFGHTKTSNSLEQTYSHLFDEDFIDRAERAMGYADDDDRPKSFTPDTCPTCGELLESHWRQCPSCQEVFGPTDDFEERLADAKDATTEEAVESLDPEEIRALKAMASVFESPEAVTERLADVASE